MTNQNAPLVFISYSHADTKLKDQLVTHLKALEHTSTIRQWNDLQIDAGTDLEPSIFKALEEAQIVLLLISPNFIASNFCMSIEMVQAIAAHKEGRKVVIPVITRHCAWDKLPFASIKAVPHDGVPIKDYKDKDKALKLVVKAVERAALNLKTATTPVKPSALTLTESHAAFLNDNGFALNNKHTSDITLDDVYVEACFEDMNPDCPDTRSHLEISTVLSRGPFIAIFGSEQSGKTTIAKRIIHEQFKSQTAVAYIDLQNERTNDLGKLIRAAGREQYGSDAIHPSIIIFDNFSTVNLNSRCKADLVNAARESSCQVIILSDPSVLLAARDDNHLSFFNDGSAASFGIAKFNNNKRRKIVTKWVEIGVRDTIDESDLNAKVEQLLQTIDTFLRRNVVPAYPSYLLMLLQGIESFTPHKVAEITSHAHCYQFLIHQRLERARIKTDEIDTYINVLTKLAGFMFKQNSQALDKSQQKEFERIYTELYCIEATESINPLIEKLVECSILIHTKNTLSFRVNYVYYFYAAKELSEEITKGGDKAEVSKLIKGLHKQDNANIVVFLTHHCKNPFFLNEICNSLNELFAESTPCGLTNAELSFLEDFIKRAPKLVYSQTNNYKANQLEADRKKDHAEQREEVEQAAIDKLDDDNILAKTNRLLKGMEVAGQIIRNRHGSLEKPKIIELATCAINAACRFMAHFLNSSKENEAEIIDAIAKMIVDKRNHVGGIESERELIEKEAREYFCQQNYLMIRVLTSYAASLIGVKATQRLMEQIAEGNGTPVYKILIAEMFIQTHRRIDADKTKALLYEYKSCPIKSRLVASSVLEFARLSPPKHETRDMLANVLGLEIQPTGVITPKQHSKYHT